MLKGKAPRNRGLRIMTKNNRLHYLGNLPIFRNSHFLVACSGGVDSMAVCDFLSRYPQNKFTPLFIDHNTETSKKAWKFLHEYYKGKVRYSGFNTTKPKGDSWEDFWRKERNKIFKSVSDPIITAHHLDDVIETWVWSSLHGKPKIIKYNNGVVYRPFLITKKEAMVQWCKTHKVPWVEDASNKDVKFARNRIRHNIVPQALYVNPGLHKVVRKLIESDFNQDA